MVLRVAGEADLNTVDRLQTALTQVLARRPAHLIVDLAALTFCSTRGLAVLSYAGDTARGHRIGYAVAGASPRLNRVWAVGWRDTERPIGFPTAADAVLAAMAHQVGAQDRARWEPKHLIPRTASTAQAITLVPPLASIALTA